MRNGDYHPAFEEYCEAIFELAEDDRDVIQARIATRLDVSRPAVSEMIKRMTAEGLLTTDDGIELTDDGMRLAQTVVRRHRIAERFLTDVLQLSWAQAHHEAGKWEHVISDEVEAALMQLLDNPETCPHGNPIPGSDYVEPDMTTISQYPTGVTFVVRRIPEELEFEPGMLEFLETHSLRPGRTGRVIDADSTDQFLVEIEGTSIRLDRFVGERMLVGPTEPGELTANTDTDEPAAGRPT